MLYLLSNLAAVHFTPFSGLSLVGVKIALISLAEKYLPADEFNLCEQVPLSGGRWVGVVVGQVGWPARQGAGTS